MLLTVYEAARILGVDARRVYYAIAFCKIDGFVKINGSLRLSEHAVEELYGRFHEAGIRVAAGDTGLRGLAARLADVRADYLADPARSAFARVPRRGRKRQRTAVGPYRMAGRAGRRGAVTAAGAQQELWDGGDFW